MTDLRAEITRQGWVTTAGNQIVDEATYHALPMYQNFRKQTDCDDYVVSIRIVDAPQRPEAISIDRPHGAPPFGPREIAPLRLLHDEIAPLIGVRLSTEEHLSRDGLSSGCEKRLHCYWKGNARNKWPEP